MDVLFNKEALLGWTIVASSALAFQFLSIFVKHSGTPSFVKPTDKGRWRWKNILVSLIHSVMSGTWACLCFYLDPKLAEDMITTYTIEAQTLVCFSVGYFIYDTLDMLRFNPSRQSYELLIHHFVIFACFSVCIVAQQYIGYATVALIIEVNSIFLHIRQLLQISGYAKNHPIFRLNSLFNFATYIVFRLLTMAWMSRWLLMNHHLVPLPMYVLGSVGLAIMTVINIILFYRLLQSDLIHRKKDAAIITSMETPNTTDKLE